MSKVVVDASAVIAFLLREPGADVVRRHLGDSTISAVNLAEVTSRMADKGMSDPEIRATVADLDLTVVEFGLDQALSVARLRPVTKHRGLSLADRACLSLAEQLNRPALTADRRWRDLDIGVEVQFIR